MVFRRIDRFHRFVVGSVSLIGVEYHLLFRDYDED